MRKVFLSVSVLVLAGAMWFLIVRLSRSSVPAYALIYSGPTTCDGCPQAVGAIAKSIGLRPRYVADPAEIPSLLSGASMFVIGGTDDRLDPMRRAFTPGVEAAVRAYVKSGGKFLGICGGAYFASQHYEGDTGKSLSGLRLIPANAIGFDGTSKPRLETVTWAGKPREMYFQAGPKFVPEPNAESLDPLARYSDGSLAALTARFGKGWVTVSGVHPEADRSWLQEDHLDASHWQPTRGLAQDMLRKLMER